jgi:hypothetical protein
MMMKSEIESTVGLQVAPGSSVYVVTCYRELKGESRKLRSDMSESELQQTFRNVLLSEIGTRRDPSRIGFKNMQGFQRESARVVEGYIGSRSRVKKRKDVERDVI